MIPQSVISMRYFYIEPEVSGELGDGTVMDTTVHPPKVDKLNYQFGSWLGDDLIESFPCYIVSERLAEKMKEGDFSGFVLDEVMVTKSQDFDEVSTIKHLTKFYWLKVNGKPFKNDISISDDHRLLVSEKLFKLIRSFNLNYADVEIFE